MDLVDMINIIEAYDGLRELENAMAAINGSSGVGYEEGAVGKLYRITDIIWRNVKDIDPDEDWDRILREIDNAAIPAQIRAQKIIGII